MLNRHSRYPWIVVGLLWVVALLNYMDRQMLSTMRPSMQVDIADLQSATNFGRLMAVFLWIYGFMSPVAGIIADRISKKKLIVGSLLVWSMVTWSMGYVHSFSQLYFLRAAMGVSEALYIPAALALIAEYHSDKTRSLAVGIHMTGLYMGQALGGFGATIAASFSWQAAFHYFGLAGIVYAFLLFFFLKDKKQVLPTNVLDKGEVGSWNVWKSLSLLFSMVPFWVILFYFAVPSLPGWGVKNWIPTLFSQSLRIDMATAGPLSTITIAVSSFAGVLVGGIVSDKWVQQNIRGRIYTSAIGLFLTIPSLMFLGWGDSLVSVLLSAICFGFGFGMFDANNMPILCQFVSPRLRATAYGFMNMMGVMAGAFITGWLGKSTDEGHLGRDFIFLALIVAVALILQLWVLRPQVINKDEN